MSLAAWFVPGRIEVFGKHTDYGGGRSLLAATEQGLHFVGRRVTGRDVALETQGRVTVCPMDGPWEPARGTARYLQTVVRRLIANFGPGRGGARIRLETTLPLAAGLSSSSALVTGLALTLADLWKLDLPSGADLVEYVAAMERGSASGDFAASAGVGVRGGAEDHAAILLATAGHLLSCRFRPVRAEDPVAWPEDIVFVVAVSGVHAEKAGGVQERYNRAAAVLEALEHRGVALGDLLDAEPRSLEDWLTRLEPFEERRVRQFLEESTVLIPAAIDAVRSRDWDAFGAAAARSHHVAAEVLGHSVAETETLTSEARALGALGASPFGAGFGGAVWAAVPAVAADVFAAAWWRRYRAAHPRVAENGTILITRPGGAAARVEHHVEGS